MADTHANTSRAQIPMMLLSAAIFAYFGFVTSWAHQYTSASAPQPNSLLPMVVLLKWTLRGAAIAFGASALVSLISPFAGALVFGVTGVITAISFVLVGIWELSNPNGYYSGMPAILLFIFAAWNGYGSWSSLRELLGARSAQPTHNEFQNSNTPPAHR